MWLAELVAGEQCSGGTLTDAACISGTSCQDDGTGTKYCKLDLDEECVTSPADLCGSGLKCDTALATDVCSEYLVAESH